MNSPATDDSEIDASVTFSEALMAQINREDVRNMVSAQRDMLCRFEKTNEMLINFNILSGNRFAVANTELKAHTQLMYEMKKDLDSIFKRIRVLKERLSKSYPDAFKACNVVPLLEDEEEGEEELRVSSTSPVSEDLSSQSSTSNLQTPDTTVQKSHSSNQSPSTNLQAPADVGQKDHSSDQSDSVKVIRDTGENIVVEACVEKGINAETVISDSNITNTEEAVPQELMDFDKSVCEMSTEGN